MIKFFAYDTDLNKIVVNEPEILLVKEFADLWTNERNVCPEDKDGHKKLRGFKDLVYIYFAIDWRSPVAKDTPENRRLLALEASGYTKEYVDKDEVLKAACRKYQQLQDSSSVLGKLVETYTNNIHKMRVFVDSIDYNERSDTGTPIFRIKDTLTEMQQISKAIDALQELEQKYKEEQQNATGLRGDTEAGMFD